MQFETFGPLRVSLDGEELALGSPQQQKLLALLLATPNHAVPTDRLIDEMWSDDPPASARHLVQVYTSRLRLLLTAAGETSRVVREGDAYTIRVRAGEVDSLDLPDRIEAARALLPEDPAGAERLLREVVAGRRGRPFGNLSDESTTLRAEAVRLEELYLGAVAHLYEAQLELGHHQDLIPGLEALTQEHPYRERFWAQRMLALYRSGRQADALRSYQTLRRILGEDLGIEPSSEVRHLEERILLQDVGLLWEVPPPPSNLPTPLTSFIGRGIEIAEVVKLLDTSRLVTLTGPGGIGKTRLAIEAADTVRVRFPDGIWWVDLSSVANPDAVVAELARLLGVSTQPGTALIDSVARALLRREAVLVIDNCEHVAAATAATIDRVLREAPRLRVLATSRVPLHVSGEARWQVPPLAMPTSDVVTTVALTAADAIQLFLARGGTAAPAFALTDENAAAVVDVCRRLDGMPLAIEMAAARLAVLAPAQIAATLNDRFAILEQPDHGTDPRHQTLLAALDWSYTLLEPRDQAVFEQLSVFAGAFDLSAAAAVADPDAAMARVLDAITALVEASMLTTVHDEPAVIRYRMLETLRSYGARLLDEHGLTPGARRRHARYALGLATEARASMATPAFASWVPRIGAIYSDLQQALDWSVQQQPQTALRAAPALFQYWFRTGDAREASRWSGRLLDAAHDAPPDLVAAAHLSAAFSSNILGDPDDAIAHSRVAVALSRECSDHRGLVAALFGMAQWALQVADFDTARTCSVEALDMCDQIDDRWGRAGPLSTLSFVLLFGGGSLDEARRNAEEALVLYRELDDTASQVVMNPLSLIALRQGDLEAAERYAAEAVAVADASAWEATALINLAEVQLATDHIRAAEASMVAGLTRALDTGLENWFRMALRGLARVAEARGDATRTALLYGASRRNMPEWGLDPDIYGSLAAAGTRALGEEDFGRLADEGALMTHNRLLELVG